MERAKNGLKPGEVYATVRRMLIYEPGSMLRALFNLEIALSGGNPNVEKIGLIEDAAGWNTLDVDYEPPRVERLWREWGAYRIYLHRIHPCAEALFHPHPWPSAVKVLSGSYEMSVGHRAPDMSHHPHQVCNSETLALMRAQEESHKPNVAATMVLRSGSSYEMLDMNSWHSVRPLDTVSYSIMVTGPKWDRWSPKPHGKLGPLSDAVKADLLGSFRHFLWMAAK